MEFADLPAGRTAFEWFGPKMGPIAVCIHGLTTPSYIFAGTARSMASLGYRTLVFDLWGRGQSDCPKGGQTPGYFLAQLNDLLAAEDINAPLTLIGYSMGAVLAVQHAVQTAYRPRALILLAPAGLEQIPRDPAARRRLAPVVGEVWARTGGLRALRQVAMQAQDKATLVPDLYARQLAETERPGYAASILSSQRHTLNRPIDDAHRAAYDLGIPTLAIWGAEDDVIGRRGAGRLAELNPDAHHVDVPGATHLLPQTHPREVADAIRAFV